MAKQMAAPDPAIGTWKLNVDKSIFKVTPDLKSYVLKVEPWQDGHKLSVDAVDVQGNTFRPEIAYKFDGRDYPLKGSPLADTISFRRIDERSVEHLWKKGGKNVLASKAVVSLDGKTLTYTRTGQDAQGRTVDDLLVLEKQ